MGEEALYNHLKICAFVYNGNTRAAINSLKEKADFLKSGTSLQIKKAYLYSLNISIYNYILLNENVSLHICCHKNE